MSDLSECRDCRNNVLDGFYICMHCDARVCKDCLRSYHSRSSLFGVRAGAPGPGCKELEEVKVEDEPVVAKKFELKVGLFAVLHEGTPIMRVFSEYEDNSVDCGWFDKEDRYCNANFPVELLEFSVESPTVSVNGVMDRRGGNWCKVKREGGDWVIVEEIARY